MKRILKGLEAALWMASVILFIGYSLSLTTDEAGRGFFRDGFVSGWWWFSTIISATFLYFYNINE